jgi:hypothetical protein
VAGPTKRETATAYHEAGHAVVGLRVGVPTRLIQVSIVPDDAAGTLGHVRRGMYPRVLDIERGDDGKPRRFYRAFSPDIDDERLVERQLRPRVVEAFAGVLAEKRFSGRGHNWPGASADLEMAENFIDYLTGSPRQAQKLSDYLWVVADDAVRIHWPEIMELAQELLTRQKMTGREIKAFLQAGTAAERLELAGLPPMVFDSPERGLETHPQHSTSTSEKEPPCPSLMS